MLFFLAFTTYYVFFWSYTPSPTPIQSARFGLDWPNQGPIFTSSEFYSIDITLSFHNQSITQYQEVIITSFGGSISKSLAKGLFVIEVNYQKSVVFTGTPDISIGHLVDLYLYPVNDSITPSVDHLVQQLPASHIEWQTVGTDYPTVTLLYRNGTQVPHPYPDQTLYVQSESVTNDGIISEIRFQREFGIAFVGVVFVSIDAMVEAYYRHFGPKEI